MCFITCPLVYPSEAVIQLLLYSGYSCHPAAPLLRILLSCPPATPVLQLLVYSRYSLPPDDPVLQILLSCSCSCTPEKLQSVSSSPDKHIPSCSCHLTAPVLQILMSSSCACSPDNLSCSCSCSPDTSVLQLLPFSKYSFPIAAPVL